MSKYDNASQASTPSRALLPNFLGFRSTSGEEIRIFENIPFIDWHADPYTDYKNGFGVGSRSSVPIQPNRQNIRIRHTILTPKKLLYPHRHYFGENETHCLSSFLRMLKINDKSNKCNFATPKVKKHFSLTIDLLSLGIYAPGLQVLTYRPQILRGVRI